MLQQRALREDLTDSNLLSDSHNQIQRDGWLS